MPSTVAHALVSFGVGLTLHMLSCYRFTALHVFLLTLHGTNGPDIGSVVEFLLSGIVPAFGTFFMQVVHSPIGYPFTLGLLWSWLGVFLSSRDVRWGGQSWLDFRFMRRNDDWAKVGRRELDEEESQSTMQEKPSQSLTFVRSWWLALAGSLIHFRLDTLYEDNGNDPLYRWIISTGYWLPGANDVIYPSVALAFALSLGGLLGTFAIIHTSLRTTLPLPSRIEFELRTANGRAIASAIVAFGIANLYLVFLFFRLSITPRVPAVGEEADFGVIIFEALTGVLPLILCTLSCQLTQKQARLHRNGETLMDDREDRENGM